MKQRENLDGRKKNFNCHAQEKPSSITVDFSS